MRALLVRRAGLRYSASIRDMTTVGPAGKSLAFIDLFGSAAVAENNTKSVKVEKRAKGPVQHPDYHFIKVVMTNGSDYRTRSTYGQPGDTLSLDIDPSTHPAWTGGQATMLDRGGRLSRFKSRFGSIGAAKT